MTFGIDFSATPQQIFDHVVAHLRKQGRPAAEEERCLYRAVDDTGNVMACAVGCLIPDEMYHQGYENFGVGGAQEVARHEGFVELSEFLSKNYRLLTDLQGVHDAWYMNRGTEDHVEGLESRLQAVAETRKLTYTPPA